MARYKACLVAKGYHQVSGIDYDETFSLVVKKPIVRIILALVAHFGRELRQFDVKNASFHGDLREEVNMQQPQGFVQQPNLVCKLLKSLYGLKQAPRVWFECFTSHLLSLGFIASYADSSLFIKKIGSSITYLLLYVDDIIVTRNNSMYVNDLVVKLKLQFDMIDLGV